MKKKRTPIAAEKEMHCVQMFLKAVNHPANSGGLQ